MNTIEQLIENATRLLENTTSVSDMVGNRPHFPMFIAMNGEDVKLEYEMIHRKLERIWPQSIEKIMFSAFEVSGEGTIIKDIETDETIDFTQMQSKLDEIKMARNTFDEMNHWCTYNIVNTSDMSSVGDFKKCYEYVDTMKELVVDSCKTMLIVLLDDSTVNREVATNIKWFLADKSSDNYVKEYDGIILISNRNKNNEMYQMDELYKIVADVLLLSNNDAVSQYDDEDYKARVSCFYKGINTLSYSILERPNRKVIIQMMNTFLKNVHTEYLSDNELNIQSWREKLNIRNNRIDICEEFIRNINFSFDFSVLKYLPFNRIIPNIKFSEMSYAQFENITFKGVLQEFIDNHFKNNVVSEAQINKCITKFENEIKERTTSIELIELKEETLMQIIKQLDYGMVNPSLNVEKYIEEQMKYSLRKNILYPRCINVIKKMKDEAIETVKTFNQFRIDFQRKIPLGSFDNIGNMYQTISENYIRSDKGIKDINQLIRAGNDYGDISGQLLEMIKSTVQNNKAKFSLSFIDEWSERLNLAGDVVFKEIHTSLDERGKGKIHLAGSYPVIEKMQIYMFHTSDASGTQPTELCNHLRLAYAGIPGTQFFNTGFDDALEVMKIIECSGDNLKL